jgi:hypothetical protein
MREFLSRLPPEAIPRAGSSSTLRTDCVFSYDGWGIQSSLSLGWKWLTSLLTVATTMIAVRAPLGQTEADQIAADTSPGASNALQANPGQVIARWIGSLQSLQPDIRRADVMQRSAPLPPRVGDTDF